MNMQQAVDKLNAGELPYKEFYEAKVRGSANKCSRVYNCGLERIPADPERFAERWEPFLKNKNFPPEFKSFKSFKTWVEQVGSLMDHVSGEREKRDQLRNAKDSWTLLEEIISRLIERHEKNADGIKNFDLIALIVLRNFARQNDCQPHQLTPGLIKLWMQQANNGQKSTIRKAVGVLNKLHDLDFEFPEGLLPAKIDDLPIVTRRRITPNFPPKCQQAISDMVAEMREGVPFDDDLEDEDEIKREPNKETTIKSFKNGINWFLCCMVELDLLDLNKDPDLAEFAYFSHIKAAFEAELDEGFYWKPLGKRTVRIYLSWVFYFLRRFNSDLEKKQKSFFKQRYFRNWEAMTPENEEFCRRLVRSDHRQSKFLNLGKAFHDEATRMLTKYDTLSFNEKKLAEHWALAAAAAAILTFLPLRATSLMELQLEGTDAHVFLPHKTRKVEFAIPSSLIKNERKIITTVSGRGRTDPRAILEWWLVNARPLVMARLEKPDETKLFGGASYDTLYRSWRFATASIDFYMNLHQVRHGIASILINQPNSDIVQIAALLGDTPATVEKIYAFFDKEENLQGGLNSLDDVNKALMKGHK